MIELGWITGAAEWERGCRPPSFSARFPAVTPEAAELLIEQLKKCFTHKHSKFSYNIMEKRWTNVVVLRKFPFLGAPVCT